MDLTYQRLPSFVEGMYQVDVCKYLAYVKVKMEFQGK